MSRVNIYVFQQSDMNSFVYFINKVCFDIFLDIKKIGFRQTKHKICPLSLLAFSLTLDIKSNIQSSLVF